jgi:glutamate-1-semialdehyde 2,1-aminomutase
MNRMHSQADWIARAREVLPAAGFGNFDASIVIARGEGSASGTRTGANMSTT